MKHFAFMVATGGGLWVALLLGSLRVGDEEAVSMDVPLGSASVQEDPHRRQPSVDKALRSSFAAFDEGVSLRDSAIDYSSRKVSPLRAHSFHRYRIENMSLEQIANLLKLGRMTYLEDYTSAGEKLSSEDPELAFQLLFERQRVESIDQFHAYLDAVISTGVQVDAVGLLRRIQRLQRGGNRQATSLRFSQRWASEDPAKAARFFDELVVLRSLKANNDIDYDEGGFATLLMASWTDQNPDAARDYVESLEEGPKKKVFQATLSEIGSNISSKSDRKNP